MYRVGQPEMRMPRGVKRQHPIVSASKYHFIASASSSIKQVCAGPCYCSRNNFKTYYLCHQTFVFYHFLAGTSWAATYEIQQKDFHLTVQVVCRFPQLMN